MKSPWTKKNPWLSMMLSGANAVAGSARSRGKAQAKRAATTAIVQGIRQAAGMWTAALPGRPAKKRKSR